MKLPHPFKLETRRLLLTSPSEVDATQVMEAVNESLEELQPWMPWADHAYTEEETIENCREAEAKFMDGSDHRLHVFLKDSLTYIGGTGLHRGDPSVPSVEIGYWVRTPLAGNGYVTEVVANLTRYALSALGVKRVEIRMSSDNERSRRIPERLGFHLDGILRQDSRHEDGSLRDTCVYSVIDTDPNEIIHNFL